jgi:CBS domain-containing protein
MTLVSEIMTSEVSTVTPEMTLREALEVLRARNVGGAPVVRGSEVVGVMSMADLLELEATSPSVPAYRDDLAEWSDWGEPEPWQEGESPPLFFVDFWVDAGADTRERMARIEGPEWDFLADHNVGEVMSRKLLSVSADDEVPIAARQMTDAGVHRVLVLDGGRLVGVLSASDVVRAVADGVL